MLTSGRTVDTPTEQLFKRAAVARAYKYFASRLLHHNPTTAVSACRALQSCPALDLPAFLTLPLQTAAVAPYRLLHTSHITVQVMNESALPAQLQARLVAVLSECHQLQGTEDPEEQPYKSLYAAADLLETLINELQAAQTQQQEAGSADQLLLLAEACAWARCLRGIVLLQTDLLHDGEADLTAGLGHPWSDSCYSHALRSRALNALGALCQERSKHTEAQQHLEAALAHYQAAKSGPWAAGRPASASAPQEATSSSSSSGDATLANNSSPDGDGATNNPAATTPSSSSTSSVNSALEQLHAAMASASGMTPAYLEQHHSLTLVTLAQVAAAQGQAAASASYCAAGLNSYLATGGWVQLGESAWSACGCSGYWLPQYACMPCVKGKGKHM